MKFKEYEDLVLKYKTDCAKDLSFNALGLTEEAGECAGKVKKMIRDKILIKEHLVKEMGDVLWYLASMAQELDVDLETIAQQNIEKIQDRVKRNVLHGSGDDR